MRFSGFGVAAAVAAVLVTGACDSGGSGGSAHSSAPAASRSAAAPSDNGVAAKDPKAILAAAQQALTSSSSVRYKGWTVESGHKFTLDLQLTPAGTMGSVTVPFDGKPATAQIIVLGKTTYMKGRQFWETAITSTNGAQAGKIAANLFGDRWVKMPSSQSLAQAAPTSLKELSSVFDTSDTITKKERKTIGGRPTIGIADSSSIMYVATTGKPQPLLIVPTGAVDQGQLGFSDYDVPVTITAPTDSIDLAKLHP